MKKDKQCYQCEGTHKSNTAELYGYTICNTCKSQLRLFQDNTINKHFLAFEKSKEENPHNPSYEAEISNKLILFDKDYISKKIKLLQIQERLEQISLNN